MLKDKVATEDEIQTIAFGVGAGGVWMFEGKNIMKSAFVEEGGEIWTWTSQVGIHSQENTMGFTTELKDM